MKSQKVKALKRAYKIKDAVPLYISMVKTGANLIPWNHIRYGEDSEQFSDVALSYMTFDKAEFSTKDAVSQYLIANEYVDFEIDEQDSKFVVSSTPTEKFEEITEMKRDKGVTMFVGKLKEGDTDAPAGEVSEELAIFGAGKEGDDIEQAELGESAVDKVEDVVDEATDAIELVATVKEDIAELVDAVKDVVVAAEHVVDEVVDLVQDVQEELKFEAEVTEEKLMFSVTGEGKEFTQFLTKFSEAIAKITVNSTETVIHKFTDEELEVFKQSIRDEIKTSEVENIAITEEFSENVVDTNEILGQNSLDIKLNEFKPQVIEKDHANAKFSQRNMENELGI